MGIFNTPLRSRSQLVSQFPLSWQSSHTSIPSLRRLIFLSHRPPFLFSPIPVLPLPCFPLTMSPPFFVSLSLSFHSSDFLSPPIPFPLPPFQAPPPFPPPSPCDPPDDKAVSFKSMWPFLSPCYISDVFCGCLMCFQAAELLKTVMVDCGLGYFSQMATSLKRLTIKTGSCSCDFYLACLMLVLTEKLFPLFHWFLQHSSISKCCVCGSPLDVDEEQMMKMRPKTNDKTCINSNGLTLKSTWV